MDNVLGRLLKRSICGVCETLTGRSECKAVLSATPEREQLNDLAKHFQSVQIWPNTSILHRSWKPSFPKL